MSRRQRRREEKQRRHAPTERLAPGRTRQLATGAGVTIGATLAIGGMAQAASFTVGTTADTPGSPNCGDPMNTDCSLRQALVDAETSTNSGSTITFASGLSGTITVAGSPLPTILYPTSITGPGAGQLTVYGLTSDPVLYAAINSSGPVTISGLTLTNGSGGFKLHGSTNSADVTLSGMNISDNTLSLGSYGGGGVLFDGPGSLTILDSTISGNSTGGTTTARGGGIAIKTGHHVPTTIRNSTISGNHASSNEFAFGGGAYLDYSAPATVENSTIYDNSAGTGAGLYHFGAYDGNPGLTVTGSTITHNTAAVRGGGIACYGAANGGDTHQLTEPILQNTIVFGNTAPAADQGPDLSCDFNNRPLNGGTFQAAFSLIGAVDPGTGINQTVPGSDFFGIDPQLGPLASNGGATQTQKPAIGSPVVDKGAAFGLSADQRGQQRPFDFPTIPNSSAAGADGSDIGSFELQLADLPSNTFSAKTKGKKLLVSVSTAGTVGVTDAAAPLRANEAKKKRGLKSSSASGGAPTITVPLLLTKQAKKKLREKGKVTVKARITFTPTGGLANTQTRKLKIKSKK